MIKVIPIQLKRCPFCGSTVSVGGVLDLPIEFFKCDNWHECGAIMSFDNLETKRYKKSAYKYFNRRVNESK